MANDVSLALRIATILDASGINKAEKSVKGFDKSLKKLGKTLGVTLSAAAVIKFGKDAARAFIEDEKEATRLATAVKNLGLEFANPAISDYIERLSLASGVSDSQLRPAFQALLTTTGSLTKSQELLAQAIDVSAGSGVELTTVAQDLANGYIGITKGLKKYNLGLTQAELKSANFADIQAKLNKQFSGANAAFLDTYAGKLSLIGTAAGEAQEQIGQAVIDLTMAVTGASDVKDLIEQIGSAADFVVARIDNFIEGFKILKLIGTKKFWTLQDLNPEIQKIQVEEFNRRMRRDYMKAWAGVDIPLTPAQEAARKKAEADAAKRAKALKDAQEKNTKELKKQAALKKANSIFDQDQIQLVAALKGKLTDEERKRVEAMSAILNGNEVLATQLTKQILMAQDASGNLYKYFLSIGDAKIKNPFAFLDEWLLQFQNKLNNLKMPTMPTPNAAIVAAAPEVSAFGAPIGVPFTPSWSMGGNQTLGASFPSTNVGTIPTGNFTYGQGNPLNTNVYVTVQGNIIREQELIDKVLAGAQLSSLSGSPSQIGRISGMFGP